MIILELTEAEHGLILNAIAKAAMPEINLFYEDYKKPLKKLNKNYKENQYESNG